MNNLRLSSSSSYTCHYFELLLAIYQVACWFLSSKIQLVLSSISFPQAFLPDCHEKLLSFRAFYRKPKRQKIILCNLVNMVNVVEQTNQNSIFFLLVRFLLNVALHYHRETTFLLMKSAGHFPKFSSTWYSCWEYKSVLSI